MDEEDIRICHHCSGEAESLEACVGGCGKELCPYCQPKCHDCADHETTQRIEEEEEEEKKRRWEAKRKAMEPERSIGQKVGRAIDWMTSTADGALGRELENWPGEFDMLEEAYRDSRPVQESIRERYKRLPNWKKKLYKAKRKGEMFVAKNVLKAGMKGGRLIGRLGHPTRLTDDDYEDKGIDDEMNYEDYVNGFDDETGYEDDANGFDEEDYENGAEDDLDTSDDQIEEEDAYDSNDKIDYEEEDEEDEFDK